MGPESGIGAVPRITLRFIRATGVSLQGRPHGRWFVHSGSRCSPDAGHGAGIRGGGLVSPDSALLYPGYRFIEIVNRNSGTRY